MGAGNLSWSATGIEAEIEEILSAVPAGVGVFRDREILYLNEAFIQMVDLDIESVKNMGMDLLFSKTPQGKEFAEEIYRDIIAGNRENHVWDNPVKRRDGTTNYLRGIVKRLQLKSGPAALVTMRDITQRRQAERLLQEQIEIFTLIGQNSSDFIYVHDPHSKLSYVSPGVEAITGYSAEDWDQHAGRYVLAGPLRDHAKQATVKALSTGEKQPAYQVKILTKDGCHRMLEVNETPFQRNGIVAGIVGVARDVTDRLEAQERLKNMNQELELRNKKLVQANQEMEAFIYTVSHDLKAPLVTLHGMTDRLQRKHQDRLDEKGQHYLTRIRANIERLEDLVLDLLELSRIGRIEDAQETFDAAETVADSIESCREIIDQKGLKITCPEKLGQIMFSRKRLVQVFSNLITNAAKYSDDHRSPLLEISSKNDNGYIHFSFKDNGRGIDEKFQEKIFGAFQRPGSRKEDEGTGIGLTIVKRIIEYNGGSIRLESTPGIGSTFHLIVPKTGNQ